MLYSTSASAAVCPKGSRGVTAVYNVGLLVKDASTPTNAPPRQARQLPSG
jgi:hypothetical protein